MRIPKKTVLLLVVIFAMSCLTVDAGQKRDERKAKREERRSSRQVSSSTSYSKTVVSSRGKCSCSCPDCTCNK